MGTYYQHLLWAAVIIAFSYGLILALVLEEYHLTLFFMTLFYLLGAVMPDVDLPRKRLLPTIAITLLLPLVGYYLSKEATHWGHFHSVVGGLMLSSALASWLLLGGLIDVAFFISGAFFGGYLSHLVTDQLYHYYQGKTWSRKSLKLW